MADLLTETTQFREWATAYPHRYGEWECDYGSWPRLYMPYSIS